MRAQFAAAGIDAGRRPETLAPAEFASLAARYNDRMSQYRRILLVVDLGEQCEAVGARARDVAAMTGAELSVLHVVEYVPVEPMGETLLPAVQIEEELVQRATSRLAEFADKLGIAASRRQVTAGNIKAGDRPRGPGAESRPHRARLP